jgi:hypothetical protein
LHSKGHKPSKVLKTVPALETSGQSKLHRPQNHICDNGAAKEKDLLRAKKCQKQPKSSQNGKKQNVAQMAKKRH